MVSKFNQPNRRALLGEIGVLAALMLQPGWMLAACSPRGDSYETRLRFADRLAETTIPATDTPGASAAKVGGFVLLAVDLGMNGLEKRYLTDVQRRLDEIVGRPFLEETPEGQTRALSSLDVAAYAAETPDSDTAEWAWRRLKAAIVAGYYASEIGASQELVFEPVPGKFENITMPADFRQRSNEGQGGVW